MALPRSNNTLTPPPVRSGAWLVYLLALLVGLSHNLATAEEIYRYPRPESQLDKRSAYPVALLERCAKQSNGVWTVKPSDLHMNQGRSIRQLANHQNIDIIWTVTSPEREAQLLPIRIPIDRGLIGWRLLLIEAKKQSLFTLVEEVDSLKKLTAGQGHDWPDTTILQQAGFTVLTNPSYDPLFNMLRLGHIDYFPRAISEIFREQDRFADQNLAIENHIALHYPTAIYYFVERNNKFLASRLEKCLKELQLNGEFKKLFYEYYGENIEKSHLQNRLIFEIKNPLIPTETPLNQKDLWFSPEENAK